MVVVRQAVGTDRAAIWRLLNQFAASYQPTERAFERSFDELLGDRNSLLLVLEADSDLRGYLMGVRASTLFANGPIFQILELCIDESHRGKSLGSVLTEEAISHAWELGCVEVVVQTRRASGFYQNLGFVTSAEHLKLKRPS